MVFHRVFCGAAVSLALLAPVDPGKRGFDAVGGIVGKGQADSAGGCDRQQMAVANAIGPDRLLQGHRQTAGKSAFLQVPLNIKAGKTAPFPGQCDGGGVGSVSHAGGDANGHVAPSRFVIAQAQQGQYVAHAGEADADPALGGGLRPLLGQRPEGQVQHVVQGADLRHDHGSKGVKVKSCHATHIKRMAHKARQNDGPEIAAAIGWKRLLATGVGGRNVFAVTQVVVLVDLIQKQHAGLGKVVGRAHHDVPQLSRGQGLVHPQAIGPLPRPTRLKR